jgi:putative SOS response-associated peptidase YedK
MCGRITQKSSLLSLGLHIVRPDRTVGSAPRFNGAPGQEHWVLRRNTKTAEYALDRLLWGLVPHWCEHADGGRRPINAKCETVASLPTFREAYRKRRCLIPVDSFFEWKAIPGVRPKRPYAIGKKSGEPFALAGIWENWRRPGTEEWVRTFAIITCPANDLVRPIHTRMPVIIAPIQYDRWLSPLDPDPRDLLVPFPSEPMNAWPISTRVNKPENDDPKILEQANSQADLGFAETTTKE